MDSESRAKQFWSYLGVADKVFLVLLLAYLLASAFDVVGRGE